MHPVSTSNHSDSLFPSPPQDNSPSLFPIPPQDNFPSLFPSPPQDHPPFFQPQAPYPLPQERLPLPLHTFINSLMHLTILNSKVCLELMDQQICLNSSIVTQINFIQDQSLTLETNNPLFKSIIDLIKRINSTNFQINRVVGLFFIFGLFDGYKNLQATPITREGFGVISRAFSDLTHQSNLCCALSEEVTHLFYNSPSLYPEESLNSFSQIVNITLNCSLMQNFHKKTLEYAWAFILRSFFAQTGRLA